MEHIPMKGKEFPLRDQNQRISHCFRKDRAAVAHDLQQRGNSFKPTGDNSHEILETLSGALRGSHLRMGAPINHAVGPILKFQLVWFRETGYLVRPNLGSGPV